MIALDYITKRKLIRHGQRHRPEGERVVRIELGIIRKRTYAYLCAGNPRIGSLVQVNTPISGRVIRPVVGFGRHSWRGPLKRATLIHR